MPENPDFPYVIRRGVQALDEHEPETQAVISTLNWLIRLAREQGVRLSVVWESGERRDVTEDRVTRFEWVREDATEAAAYLEELDILSASEAADLLGLSRDALYRRIRRAEKQGNSTPFRRVGEGGSAVLLAERSALLKWAGSWTGRRGIRPKRAASSSST